MRTSTPPSCHGKALALERTADGYWFIDVLPPDESPATARRVAAGAARFDQAVALAIQKTQAGEWEGPF